MEVEAELVKSREEGGQGEENRQELYRCCVKVEAELVKSREEGGEARRRAEDLQRAYEENRQELANHLAK